MYPHSWLDNCWIRKHNWYDPIYGISINTDIDNITILLFFPVFNLNHQSVILVIVTLPMIRGENNFGRFQANVQRNRGQGIWVGALGVGSPGKFWLPSYEGKSFLASIFYRYYFCIRRNASKWCISCRRDFTSLSNFPLWNPNDSPNHLYTNTILL